MEVDVSKEKVCINKLICTKKELFFVEEDMIVPDTKPDILNTINLSGNVCIYKKEAQDEKVKIDGCVNTCIMYLPDCQENNLRGLNANIDFSKSFNIPEAKEGMTVKVCINIKDLECKVLNGRKINVRAGLEVIIKLYSNEDVEIINKINNVENIQTLEETLNINSMIGSGNTRVYVKDTLNLDTQDSLLEVLKAEINLVNNDIKLSYNKIISKCEVEVNIMYLTEDNRINTIKGNIPAVGFVDIQNVSEDSICDVKNDIKNIMIRPNAPEEHSIYVEIELDTMCMVFEKKNIKIIQDLYSPTVDLTMAQKNIITTRGKTTVNKAFTITSKTSISDLTEGNLLDVGITTNINKEHITTSKIMYEGELVLNFVYTKENNSVGSKNAKIPFEFSIDNPAGDEKINIETTNMINNKNFIIKSGGNVECAIDMEFETKINQNVSINIIDNIQIQENRVPAEDYDSLIMYIVQTGDTLWKIAKRFRSTIEDIVVFNGIEDENKIFVGQKIYIPKFNYMNRV